MKKAVIIGAGPAGITAGYELLKNKGFEAVILEESDAIGGISRTVRHGNNRMDIGGHRFFSKDKAVVDWWEALLPSQGAPSYDDRILGRESILKKGGPNPDNTDRVMLKRNRVSRIYYNRRFFDYPVTMKLQTFKNMGLICTVKAGFSYLKAAAHKREENSLEDFYINRFGKVLYSMFFESYTEKLWGKHPSEISADWGAQRVKGLSIKAVIRDMISKISPNSEKKRTVETSLIESFSYPKYGPGQLWETAASDFEKMGGKIIKNARVKRFELNADGSIKAAVYELDGKEEKCEGDYFISSMPVKDLVNGLPNAADEILRIANGLPYRDFVTLGVLVKKLNMKNETNIKTLGDIVPDCWIYVQDAGIKLGRIQIFNNWSPYMVENPQENIWIGLEYFCSEGDSFWNMTEEETLDFAAAELVKMGVISAKSDILDCHKERVKKAYPAYFDTYSEMDTLIDYLSGIKNLFCIGRNGQHRYNNMDHSMETAFRAVDCIVNNIEDKTEVWNVNTDKEYHEVKTEE